MEKYILRDGQPVACWDLMEWGRFMENGDARTVAKTDISDDVRVSTVFLGLDHNFVPGSLSPILWETMIFGGEHDQYQNRYRTLEEAEKGHEKACKIARGELDVE